MYPNHHLLPFWHFVCRRKSKNNGNVFRPFGARIGQIVVGFGFLSIIFWFSTESKWTSEGEYLSLSVLCRILGCACRIEPSASLCPSSHPVCCPRPLEPCPRVFRNVVSGGADLETSSSTPHWAWEIIMTLMGIFVINLTNLLFRIHVNGEISPHE